MIERVHIHTKEKKVICDQEIKKLLDITITIKQEKGD